MSSTLRNVAIIAHVDHGKTTLVDQLLKQSGMFRAGELDKLAGGQHGLIMDSNPIERERGITILSKNCAITYLREDGSPFRINIIDTPGHADFGGEVERVLRMADGCLLVVDSFDGPMPQTRFVLGKAMEAGLKPVVVVNKCDRPDGRGHQVIDEVFELLMELGADDDTLDFPVVYASARDGWATRDLAHKGEDLRPVFDAIINHVPPAGGDAKAPLQMLITTIDYSDYVGRIGIGRVFRGTIRHGQAVAVIARDGSKRNARVQKLQQFSGLGRTDAASVEAGDLCAVIGLDRVDIGDTICDPATPEALPGVPIDEPTISMLFRINDSPFAGAEGEYVTSRQINDRLQRELQHNVALRVETGRTSDEFIVSGRGLLHLGILIENMRREGFEMSVGKPEVILREIDGVMHEPIERLVIDCPQTSVGSVMELVGMRKGEIKHMESRGDHGSHLIFEAPARGLIGLRSRLLTATQGEAIMHHTFDRYVPVMGELPGRQNGVMVATEGGAATAYAIENLADRGVMLIKPTDKVYEGMIVGEHNRDNDLPVNITKMKPLTNIRSANKEATVTLKGARNLSLEAALEYIEDDELVEITPSSIRLRKRLLKENDRKRSERSAKNAVAAR
ncbi:MAG: translational GTPase TypA [Phycisphaerales bacterium]|nr:MAG: translational GTPase TypA [Phycisphaerales bacterium]